MNDTFVAKVLETLVHDSLFLSKKQDNYVIGISNNDIKKIKKHCLLENLIAPKDKGFILTKKGNKLINACKNTKLDFINLEYLKLEKTPPILTKAIRKLAKHYFENEELEKDSLEFALKNELKNIDKNLKLDFKNNILNENINSLGDLYDKFISLGLTKSIITLLLIDFFVINKEAVAIYEKGEFCFELNAYTFDKMNANPPWYGFKRAVIENKLLDDFASVINSKQNIIDFTKKLYSQFKKLHKIVFETNNLSSKTLKFKNTLLNAKDPIILFEKELCVLFKEKKEFQYALSELKSYYPKLLDELEKYTLQSFCVNSLDELKTKLAKIKEFISNKELLIFTNNLESIERLATYVNQKRCPKDWNDLDVADYKLKIKNYSNEYCVIQSALEFDESLLDENTQNLINEVLKLNKSQRALLLRGIVA